MHINSRAGWKQSGLQEHRRLVRLEASYQSQFLVWSRRRRSQSNNQTSTLIFCYNHYLKKMNIMKRSLSWSHWPGSHWNGSTPIKSELSPGQENQHKSSQSFTLNMQSKLSPFSNFASWKSPLQLHFVALVFTSQESACCFLWLLWLPATTICVNPWRICQVASSSLCKSWFCPH